MKFTLKLLIINILYVIILSFTSLTVSAQIFNSEQNPLSVKWRQINASGFRIIYPQELEKEAQRMANTLSYIYPHVGASLGRSKTEIPVILQNRGVMANGFVQLAPKKSEFFTTPPQQYDSQDWLNNLAVHELRHMAQFDKLTGGKAHPFSEDIYFAWFGVSIPLWAFEGDAVTIETALTNAGRGKQPSWIMPYRANLLDGKKFSYSKINFGSQKDITPGYYQLGYLMTSTIKAEFGKGIIDSILGDIRQRPIRLYPFSNSLKKFTGLGTKKWFDKTTKILTNAWSSQNDAMKTEDYRSLNKASSYAANYFMPVRLPDGKILALKQSKSATSYFVTIDNQKKETRLFGIGYQEQPWFSFSNNKITWDEIRYDPRYRQRSYSVICTYNFDKRKISTITHKSRIFSPSISSDGTKIVAVEIDLNNKSNLVVLDANTGNVMETLKNPENLILQNPSFDNTGKLIAYLGISEKGKAVFITDGNSRNEKVLDESQQQIGRPIFTSRGIVFNAHYSGIDNIYELDTLSKNISALSAAKYGAFNPSISDSTMLFNNYQSNGYHIAQTAIKHSVVTNNYFVNFNEITRAQEKSPNVFLNVPDSSYSSRPYHALGNLFNVHSLIPTIENEYRGGLQLVSNNLLNTFDYFGGVEYLRDLNRVEYSTGFTFKALYPILTTTFRNRPRRTFYTQNKVTKQGDWRENNIQLQASLPLSFNSLNDTYNISINTLTSYTQRYMTENLPSTFIKTLNFPMQYSMSLSHAKRQAERDIAPKWAQVLRLTYLHQPFDNNLKGGQFAAEGFLYFPGLARNHSFLANFNWQNSWGIRRFDQQINTVYGYNNILAKSKLENTLLFNYRFPIAFPDAELGPIAYIRNIRASLFCHYENIGTETNFAEPKTYGFELRSNMNLLRYQPDVELGGRCVFVNKIYHQNPIFELILNYTF